MFLKSTNPTDNRDWGPLVLWWDFATNQQQWKHLGTPAKSQRNRHYSVRLAISCTSTQPHNPLGTKFLLGVAQLVCQPTVAEQENREWWRTSRKKCCFSSKGRFQGTEQLWISPELFTIRIVINCDNIAPSWSFHVFIYPAEREEPNIFQEQFCGRGWCCLLGLKYTQGKVNGNLCFSSLEAILHTYSKIKSTDASALSPSTYVKFNLHMLIRG